MPRRRNVGVPAYTRYSEKRRSRFSLRAAAKRLISLVKKKFK